MAMRAIKERKYTLDEYFELERDSEEKWEFWDGNVWCMSGASVTHEDIVANLVVHLRNKLAQGCRVYASNLKVGVPTFPPYRYPDLSVVCQPREIVKIGGMDVLVNPQMLVEVLSPSTEAFDRGAKFTYYKSIPSLREYLLVATDRPLVTQFIKHGEIDWLNRDIVGIESHLELPTFAVELDLTEIYRGIGFPKLEIPDPELERPSQEER